MSDGHIRVDHIETQMQQVGHVPGMYTQTVPANLELIVLPQVGPQAKAARFVLQINLPMPQAKVFTRW